MIYDPAYIYAVCAVQEKYGPEKAEEIFNKLYAESVLTFGNTGFPVAQPWVAGQDFVGGFASPNDFKSSIDKFQKEVNVKANDFIQLIWIKETVEKVGLPSADNSQHGVPWIKAFREVSGLGLYAAKHTRDYVMAHEDEWSSIINYV
jgi:hypothetical protein